MHAPPSALKTCRSPAESYFRAGQGRDHPPAKIKIHKVSQALLLTGDLSR